MFRWFNILLVGAALFCSTFAEAWDCRTNARFNFGYRRESIDWRFKLPSHVEHCFDDVLSSKFDDIHVLEIGAFADATFCDCLYGRVYGNLGWILDGKNREKVKIVYDEFYDHVALQDQVSVRNVLDGRYRADFSVAVGAPFECFCSYVRAIPVIGYGYRTQYLLLDRNMRIRYDDQSSLPEATSENVAHDVHLNINDCHDDKWITRFWGPFIGLDLFYDSCDCWRLFAKAEGHFSYFKAKRESSVDFNHFIDNFDTSGRHAHGYILRFGGEYDFCNCWFVGFETDFQHFTGNKSKNICHHDHNGGSDYYDRVHLKAKLYSWALKLNIGSYY